MPAITSSEYCVYVLQNAVQQCLLPKRHTGRMPSSTSAVARQSSRPLTLLIFCRSEETWRWHPCGWHARRESSGRASCTTCGCAQCHHQACAAAPRRCGDTPSETPNHVNDQQPSTTRTMPRLTAKPWCGGSCQAHRHSVTLSSSKHTQTSPLCCTQAT